MRRVIVLGGLGHFGRVVVEQLEALGIAAARASRRPRGEIRLDANRRDSIRVALKKGDLVVDAAGPFQVRSTALLEAAIEMEFDVIDINDDLSYAKKVIGLRDRIDAAGIRVLSSASSVSAIGAAMVVWSGIAEPRQITGFLAPATRHTANSGSALSLIRSVGQPIRVLHEGQLRRQRGWSEARRFRMPNPVGPVNGGLFESADAIHLPRIWPSLTDVKMFVDTRVFGVNFLLRVAARLDVVRRVLERQIALGTAISRILGSTAGGIGYEIVAADGQVARVALLAGKTSYLAALAPAVLAAQAIVQESFKPQGLVMPNRHVEPSRLAGFLSDAGVRFEKLD